MGEYIYKLTNKKRKMVSGEEVFELKYWDKPSYSMFANNRPLVGEKNIEERLYVYGYEHGASVQRVPAGPNYDSDYSNRLDSPKYSAGYLNIVGKNRFEVVEKLHLVDISDNHNEAKRHRFSVEPNRVRYNQLIWSKPYYDYEEMDSGHGYFEYFKAKLDERAAKVGLKLYNSRDSLAVPYTWKLENDDGEVIYETENLAHVYWELDKIFWLVLEAERKVEADTRKSIEGLVSYFNKLKGIKKKGLYTIR